MDTRTAALEKPVTGRKTHTSSAFPVAMLQRKCACGGTATNTDSECDECRKKKLQRRAADSRDLTEVPPIVEEVLDSSGQPLDAATREYMEPRFGHDFSRVRVHTDQKASESAKAVNALAYTVGQKVVFAAGQYAPGKKAGQKLLAHELTHVVQQRKMSPGVTQAKLEIGPVNDGLEQEAERCAEKVAGVSATATAPPVPPALSGSSPQLPALRLQRTPADQAPAGQAPAATAPDVAAAGLIVEDDVQELVEGQMHKTEFLDRLREEVCHTAETALAPSGRTASGCPFIESWITRLRGRSSQYVERAIRKYAPESAGSATAAGYIPPVGAKVQESVARWAESGEISGVPPELMTEALGGGILGAIGTAFAGLGGAISSVGRLFTKPNAGGPRDGNPMAIRSRLNASGPGRPLESGVKARMESAFGHSFDRVRVHADSRSAQLSSSLNARAFAVGTDVAFAAGEYQPGTPVGDALIAHELAHVVQQGSGSPAASAANGSAEYSSLEEDADSSAIRAMLSLWAGAKLSLEDLGRNALPRLRSGLKLQRCGPSWREPRVVQQEFDTAQSQIVRGLAAGPGGDDVRLTLQHLQGIYADQLEDAGQNRGAQAQAQTDFTDAVHRLQESFQLQIQLTQRYGVRFTSEHHEIERRQTPPRVRYDIRVWSLDELNKVNAILQRAPRGSLTNVQKIQRERSGGPDVPAAWQQNVRTVFIYDLFFDQGGDDRAQYLLHEIGHSAVGLLTVGGFESLPPPEWMQLSDWRTSTAATFGQDIGVADSEARSAMGRIDNAQQANQAYPRPVQIGRRMVVIDRYVRAGRPNQYLHYAVAHNAEFVTDYARSHPADDLAESYAKSVLRPRETQQLLDVGPRGNSNKWKYLTAVLAANESLAQATAAASASGQTPAPGAVQPKLRFGHSNDRLEREADLAAERVMSLESGESAGISLSAASQFVQRAPAAPESSPAKAPAMPAAAQSTPQTSPTQPVSGASLIVEDDAAQLAAGQMHKTQFLDGLRTHVCQVADSVLVSVRRTAEGCPMIERWIAHLRTRNSQYVERGIRRYAQSTGITTARDYYDAVGERVRQGVSRWAATGDTSGVPPELMSEMSGGGVLGALSGIASGIGSAVSGAVSGIGRLFTKAREGGAREADPVAIKSQLDHGSALNRNVQSKMERAFGHNFSSVRVHASGRANELSSSINARAFTIGNDVAFAAGQYQPGTPAGDALIAHELAHVVQQGQAAAASTKSPSTSSGPDESRSLEEDADHSSVSAISTVYGGGTLAGLRTIGSQAAPRLRSGLRLQRCGHHHAAAAAPAHAVPRAAVQTPALGSLEAMTAWQLAQLPAASFAHPPAGAASTGGAGSPTFQDYQRANTFISALFSRFHIPFDADRERRVLGREATPQEIAVIDRLMQQLLAVPGVNQAVTSPGGRGIPTPSGTSTPSLAGRARVLNNDAEFMVKRYQLQWLVAGVPNKPFDALQRDVQSMWGEMGTQPASDAVITEQERRAVSLIAFVSERSHTPGFYSPVDDMFYLTAGSDLSDPEVQSTARHETMHLLGGRDRTRQAFVQRFGSPHYIRFWSPFEEGMAELINMEASRPVAAPVCSPGLPQTMSQYGPSITLMCELINSPGMGRDFVFQAYFTGSIPVTIFEFLERRAPAHS